MSYRYPVAAFAVMAVVALTPVVTTAQSTDVPRTTWGDPDLQGVWDFRTTTPLERPDELAAKTELTTEETAAQKARAHDRYADREPPPGDPGAYNVFWLDTPGLVEDRRTSLIIDPPDGKLPALVPAAEHQVASLAADAPGPLPVRHRSSGRGLDGPEDRGLAERCILGFAHGPPLTPGGYNQNVQLFQTSEFVVILNEMVHDPRIVPLDGRPHLPNSLRQWNGDARGYWDGGTLVIESRNFTDKTASFNPTALAAIGTGESLQLTERLTRVGANVLQYEYTVYDPTTFTQTFTAAIPLRKSEAPMYEYACHEGNYGLYNILAGARAEEATAAASK